VKKKTNQNICEYILHKTKGRKNKKNQCHQIDLFLRRRAPILQNHEKKEEILFCLKHGFRSSLLYKRIGRINLIDSRKINHSIVQQIRFSRSASII
jgi:hypothetical protein